MVVFGGIDEAKRLNDLWKYDIGTRVLVSLLRARALHSSTAMEQRPISGSWPSPRAHASRLLRCPIPLPYGHPPPIDTGASNRVQLLTVVALHDCSCAVVVESNRRRRVPVHLRRPALVGLSGHHQFCTS